MNNIKYSFITLVLFTWSMSVQADIKDEIAGGANPDTDRPMARGLNINLNSIQKAFDKADVRKPIRKFRYDWRRIYKLRLREMMPTLIILPKGEKIVSFILGDKTNFEFIPKTSDKYKLENMATIKGTYAGADTNLTIVGISGNVYSFYIRIDSVKSKYISDFVYYIYDEKFNEKIGQRISKREAKLDNILDEKTADYLRTLPDIDISKLNFNYRTSNGDNDLAPARIFDDGYFTYFQYSESGHIDNPRKLPVLYRVVDGYDSPVNTRIENGMLIAETISKGWTLRSGEAHLCVKKAKK